MGVIYIDKKKPIKKEIKIARDRPGGSGIIRINKEACDVLEGVINKLTNDDISICKLASLLIINAAENNIIKEKRGRIMGIPVLIMGESGSGKSASMRNCKGEEFGVFSVYGKPFPFRNTNDLKTFNNATYNDIVRILAKEKMKAYVIDDSQYLMSFEMFDRVKEKGYEKFTELAVHFKSLIDFIVKNLSDDIIVYFLHHIEKSDDGKLKAKTIGKMLDEKITLEGLFSIVLYCENTENTYKFITQGNGLTTAKSPMGMFDGEIDNDLTIVDDTIREYYELKSRTKTEKGE